MVLAQRPNSGHEDMAYSRARYPWSTLVKAPRMGEICVELDLVCAATCLDAVVGIAFDRGLIAVSHLDYVVGVSDVFPS